MSESNNNIPMRITQLEEATAYEDGMYYAVAKAGSGTKKISAGIVNNVLINHTKELLRVKDATRASANLIDQSTVTHNAILTSTGGTAYNASDYTVSDYIPVNGKNISGNFAKSNGIYGFAVFDQNFVFIRIGYGTNLQKYEFQSGDHYVRFGWYPTSSGNQICEYGDSYSDYSAYSLIDGVETKKSIDITTKNVASLSEVKQMAHNGENLIDNSKLLDHAFFSSNGSIVSSNDNYTISDYIPTNGKNISGNFAKSDGVIGIVVFDKNLDFIRAEYGSSLTKYIYQDGDAFVRFGFAPINADKQLCIYGDDYFRFMPFSIDKRFSGRFRKTFHSFDEPIDAIGTDTYRGFATRYEYHGFIQKVGVNARYKSSSSTVIVKIKIWDGTFTNVLFSSQTEVPTDSRRNQWAFVTVPSNLYIDGDIYISASVDSGGVCTTPSNGNNNCTATDTYRNKYILASDSSDNWASIAGKTYCLDVALFDYVSEAYNTPKNIIYIGNSAGCDYSTIQSALNDIVDDTPNNPYIFYIMPGIYEKFSAGNYNNRPRNISFIGCDANNTIVTANTGSYWNPPAEICTNGTVKNITFSHITDAEHYSPDTGHDGAYALHTDFGTCETRYENCIFESNCGPAVGLGLWKDSKIEFVGCKFNCIATGDYGTNEFGALFAHTDTVANSTNQFLLVKDSISINKYGSIGTRFTVPDSGRSGSTYQFEIQNFASYNKNNTPSVSINDPDNALLSPYCYNNVPTLP